jgi:hypothetical protein
MTTSQTPAPIPELPAERARLVEEAKRLMGAFAAQVARNVRSTWSGGPVDERAEDRARAAAEAAIELAAAPTPASVQPVAWQERQEVRPGEFGEWYERKSGWSASRPMEIESGGIRYQFRALGVIDPTPAVATRAGLEPVGAQARYRLYGITEWSAWGPVKAPDGYEMELRAALAAPAPQAAAAERAQDELVALAGRFIDEPKTPAYGFSKQAMRDFLAAVLWRLATPLMANGLTEAETSATASVAGLMANGPAERTPADYAIEHAGYLATAAEELIHALDELGRVYLLMQEAGEEDEEELSEAEEAISEARQTLRNRIHGFTTRRDRALAVRAASVATAEPRKIGRVLAERPDGVLEALDVIRASEGLDGLMTVTVRAASVAGLAGAETMPDGWLLDDVREKEPGVVEIGHTNEDDVFYGFITVDTDNYYQPDAAMPIARAIVSALAKAASTRAGE